MGFYPPKPDKKKNKTNNCKVSFDEEIWCLYIEIAEKYGVIIEKEYMKLYFNDTEVPVIWESNQTVQELMEEAGKGDIVVQMSMYSDNE